MYPLANKTSLITGGSKGIGLAIARKFAQNGANVTILSRNNANLLTAMPLLSNPTNRQTHRAVQFDVASRRHLTDSDIHGRLSDIDILVNSAGISQVKLLHATSLDEIQRLIDVNLLGTILTTQSFLKPMMRKRSGCIINISSVLAVKGMKGSTIYSATKAGLFGFTKSLAMELGSIGIRTNCLSLGLVETDMGKDVRLEVRDHFISNTPLGRLVTPEEVADAALHLATCENYNGTIINVDGGYV